MANVHSGDVPWLKTVATITRGLLVGYLALGIVMAATFTASLLLHLGSSLIVAGIVTLTTLGGALLNLAAFVGVCVWVYLAHANLRAARLPELRFAPGWAVGSFFVPVANLIVPFVAMRDLYNRSTGEPPHFAAQSVPDVTSWWTCTVIGGLIQLLLIAIVAIELGTNIHFTTPLAANLILALFGVALLFGSAFFLHRIIGAITRAQSAGLGAEQAFA